MLFLLLHACAPKGELDPDAPPLSGVHIVTYAPALDWLPSSTMPAAVAQSNALEHVAAGSAGAIGELGACGATLLDEDADDPVLLADFPPGHGCASLFASQRLRDLGADVTLTPSACPSAAVSDCVQPDGYPTSNRVMGVDAWRTKHVTPGAATVVVIDTALRGAAKVAPPEPFNDELRAWSCVTRDICATSKTCTTASICSCGGACPDEPTMVSGSGALPIYTDGEQAGSWEHGVMVSHNAVGSTAECEAAGSANAAGLWFARVYSTTTVGEYQSSFWDVWKVLKQVRNHVQKGNLLKVAVVNLSANAYDAQPSAVLQQVTEAVSNTLWLMGVPVVVSAGNAVEGTDAGYAPLWPATSKSVVPVTGLAEWTPSTPTPKHDPNTRVGLVDGLGMPFLGAPSDEPGSAILRFGTSTTMECSQGMSSGAAAHVSGLIAAVRAEYPNLSAAQVVSCLRSAPQVNTTYGAKAFSVQPATLPASGACP